MTGGFAQSGKALPRSVLSDVMAAVRRWTGRTLRSLFPPISRRRLRFRGGLFALPIYVLLILIYPLSLQQAE